MSGTRCRRRVGVGRWSLVCEHHLLPRLLRDELALPQSLL